MDAPKLADQPDLRELQIAVYGGCPDAHSAGDFFNRHTVKEPKLNHLSLSCIDRFQTVQRLVKCDDIDRRRVIRRLLDALIE